MPKRTVLAPLDYFTLKSKLLELTVLDQQLAAQVAQLQQRKNEALRTAGLPLANVEFDDAALTVISHVPDAPAAPPADPPPPTDQQL